MLFDGGILTEGQAESLLCDMAGGRLDAAVITRVLTTMRDRGETGAEVAGFARGVRGLAKDPGLEPTLVSRAIDIVGTGGDGAGTYNISTGAALLVAACGVPVVKHGNRAVSSRSGSADVLEALGLPMPMSAAGAAACLRETNFTFLFAPAYHPAMAALAPVRKAIGTRTIFNILGPLTNPACPPYGLIGAYSLPVARLMAAALATMPIRGAFVVHGDDGLDEATCAGPFTIVSVPGRGEAGGAPRVEEMPGQRAHPETACTLADLRGGDAAHNAAALRRALSPGAAGAGALRNTLILNAELALRVTGGAAQARSLARETIESGRAAGMLDTLQRFGEGLRKGAA